MPLGFVFSDPPWRKTYEYQVLKQSFWEAAGYRTPLARCAWSTRVSRERDVTSMVAMLERMERKKGYQDGTQWRIGKDYGSLQK